MEKKRKQMKKSPIGLCSLFFLILLSTSAVQQKKPEVPYVATPNVVVTEMLKMADVGKDDVLYDLGCGDGRIVIMAAKNLGCRGVGIDIDPQRIKESQENAIKEGVSDRVEFLLMDLFEADIRRATVVTLYLLSDVNLRLRPKLLRELEPGTRVVSHEFGMDTWNPDESTVVDDKSFPHDNFFEENYFDKHDVYLWIVPANVTGVWKWTMAIISGEKQYTLKLDQTFQEVKGEAFEGFSSIPIYIKNGKVKGNRLEFTLERDLEGHTEQSHFVGFARDNSMEGNIKIEGKPGVNKNWRATRTPSTVKSIDR